MGREEATDRLKAGAGLAASLGTIVGVVANVATVAGGWITLALAAVASAIAAGTSILALRRKQRSQDSGQVFIIYAREDSEKANRIAGWLREQGFSPWLDRERIEAGANWRDAIEDAMDRSGAALVIVTDNLNASAGAVEQEIRQAMSTMRSRDVRLTPVIPVLMGSDALPDALKDTQAVSFEEEGERVKLREGLQRVLGGAL